MDLVKHYGIQNKLSSEATFDAMTFAEVQDIPIHKLQLHPYKWLPHAKFHCNVLLVLIMIKQLLLAVCVDHQFSETSKDAQGNQNLT